MKNPKKYVFAANSSRTIGGIELMDKSERTFDIKALDLANNEALNDLLGLYYYTGGFGLRWLSKEERHEKFCGYLASLSGNPDYNAVFDELLTNPVVRVLISDGELMKKVKGILEIKTFGELKKGEVIKFNSPTVTQTFVVLGHLKHLWGNFAHIQNVETLQTECIRDYVKIEDCWSIVST